MRLTMLLSALSTEAPSPTSRCARRNSSDTGGPAFSVTAPRDCETDWPAFMELAISSMARGRPASNLASRWPRRLRRYRAGRTYPTTARTGTARLTPKRAKAISANASAAPSCRMRNSYGRSARSALARSAASGLAACWAAIHTGAPVGSNRRRSCSLTSARVRYVTRALGPLSDSMLARWRVTMPYMTRMTPSAAATDTTTTASGMASRTPRGSLRRRRRELPFQVHVAWSDPARRLDRRAVRVGLSRRGLVVLVRLERVFEDRVGEQPVHVFGVARGHEDGEAARELRRSVGRRDRPHPDDVEVSEDGAHDRNARIGPEDRRVDGGEHRDAVAALHVAAHAHQLGGRYLDGDKALGDGQVGDVAAAEQVWRLGDQVRRDGGVGRNVDSGAFALNRFDVIERQLWDWRDDGQRQVGGLDLSAGADRVFGHHHFRADGCGGEKEGQAGDSRGGRKGEDREDCPDDDVGAAASRPPDIRRHVTCSLGL